MKKSLVLAIALCMLTVGCVSKPVTENRATEAQTSELITEAQTTEAQTTEAQTTEAQTEIEETMNYMVVFTGTDLEVLSAVDQIRELCTDFTLEEAKLIVSQESAIVKVFDDESSAQLLTEQMSEANLNAQCVEVSGDFSLTNIFRVDSVFALSSRGTVATGYDFTGTLVKGEEVLLIKKDGTTVLTQINDIEVYRDMKDETEIGEGCGVGLVGVEKADVEAGDILVSLRVEEAEDESESGSDTEK